MSEFAACRPDELAVTSGATSHTWLSFHGAVGEVERILRGKTPDGGRVALILADPLEVLVWFFACARAGRIAMILNPDWPGEQRETILEATAPDLIVEPECTHQPDLQSPAATDGSPERAPSEETLFYAGFTSGSTGTPKGYVRAQGSWLESFKITDQAFAFPPVVAVFLPGQMTHSLHLYGAVHGLDRGHPVHVFNRFDPRQCLARLRQVAGPVVLYATPTQLSLLARGAANTGPLECIALILTSGDKSPAGRVELYAAVFPKTRVFEFYGSSEASFVSAAPQDGSVPSGSVGRSVPGVDVIIGNPESPYPPGVPGRIWVQSPLLFSRYLCGDTPDTKWHGPWLTFGDRGYLDATGLLYLTGRSGRMVVTSGVNVFPEDVEQVLRRHPLIVEAVVIGLPDSLRGERLEAVIQKVDGGDLSPQEVQAYCRAALGDVKTPRKVHLRQHIPLTSGGKPDIQGVMETLGKS
nr:AMP-binding protein [Roseibium denhamense]